MQSRKPITQRNYTPKATISTPKAKRSEVPKEYRRNRKQEAIDLLLIIALTFGTAIALVFLLTL